MKCRESNMVENEVKLRTITGKVVSNKMDKTITVLVERVVKHPVYGKYIKRSTKMMAHDEQNVCQEGDLVSITSCRPLSKHKTFKLVEVLESTKL
jgi:small subunit ribosomal protein S17